MTMSINSLMLNEGADVFYTPRWHRFIETHLLWLRNHPEIQILQIDPHDAYKYEADLIGLLQQYQIPMEHHWIVMRLNEMTSLTQFRSDQLSLFIPPRSVIDQLRAVYVTTNKKIA